MPNKGQRARLAIVEAARKLFYHKGYGATSYADIADRSGYGKGNIQYYFKSKNDILIAVTGLRLKNIANMLQRWTSESENPFNALDRFIDLFENEAVDLSRYGCPMGTLIGELGKDDAELQAEARRMFDLFLRWLEARFGGFLPADQAKTYAEQLMVMAQGISTVAHAYGDPGLIKRQTRITRQWLADICDVKPQQG